MKIALLVITSLYAAFMLRAVEFTGFSVGSDAALRQLLTSTVTEIDLTVGQDGPIDNVDLKYGGRYGTFETYEELVTAVRVEIRKSVEEGVKSSFYDPSLPVSIFWGAMHVEVYEVPGQDDQAYVFNPFFGLFEFIPVMVGGKLTISDADLQAMKVQINRVGVSLRFPSNITRARLNVTDRKTGALVRSKDTDEDFSDNFVWLGSGFDGDVKIEEQFLTHGGANGEWDVRLTLNFENGLELTYDGSGDLLRRLHIDSEGKLTVTGGVPSEVVQIEESTDLKNWSSMTGNGVVITRSGTGTQIPGVAPTKFFRIKQ